MTSNFPKRNIMFTVCKKTVYKVLYCNSVFATVMSERYYDTIYRNRNYRVKLMGTSLLCDTFKYFLLNVNSSLKIFSKDSSTAYSE